LPTFSPNSDSLADLAEKYVSVLLKWPTKLATDGAYKKTLEDLSGKRAALQTKQRAENIPDFSKEKPVAILDLESRLK
jgi:hypothetical protein